MKQLHNEANKDLQSYDEHNLDHSFNMSTCRIKWFNRHHTFLKTSYDLDKKLTAKFFEVRDNIELTSNEVLSTEVLNKEVLKDKSYMDEKTKVDDVTLMSEYCLRVVDLLDKKGWEIKSYLDYLKWREGK